MTEKQRERERERGKERGRQGKREGKKHRPVKRVGKVGRSGSSVSYYDLQPKGGRRGWRVGKQNTAFAVNK